MLKLYVLAAVCFLSSGNALPFEPDTKPSLSCPGRDLSGALAYTKAFRATNRQIPELDDDDRDYRFELEGEIDDVYYPGETYEFEVLRDDDVPSDDIHHYYVHAATLLDDQSCGHGVFRGYTEAAAPKDDCSHVIEYRRQVSDVTGELDEDKIAFEWTAPECGCVTISAVVVTAGNELVLDDERAVQGPLTLTLCASSSPDNNLVPGAYDNDFYGIDEEGESDYESNLLDEVNDIISEEDDLDDNSEEIYESEEDIDDDAEGGDVEEDQEYRRGKGRGRGNWGGRRRGKHGNPRSKWNAGKRKGRYSKIEDSEEYDENAMPSENREEIIAKWRRQYHERQELKRKGEDRTYGRRNAKKHHKHGGKHEGKPGMFYKGKKAAHLRSICQRLSDNEDPPMMKKSVSTKLTPEAREARESQRAEAMSAMSECCVDWDEEDEDAELIACFTDIHEQRLEEKMCTAESDDFKVGELPPKIGAAREECCQASGEERGECLMKTLRLLKRMKMQRKGHNWKSDEDKVTGICKWVEKSLVPHKRVFSKMSVVDQRRWTDIFTARRVQMKECCQLTNSSSEQATCLSDLREERFDRVCNGKEPLKPPGHKDADTVQDVTDQCCVLEGDERYECFNEFREERRRGHHHGHRRGHHHHHQRGDESRETEDSDVGDEVDTDRPVPSQKRRQYNKPGKYGKNGKKNRMGRMKKVAFKRCCRVGRKAGNDIEVDSSESKWLTCQNEAKGFMLNKRPVQKSEDVCHNAFRKCCMGVAIGNAKDEAIIEAEENLNGENDL